MYVLYNLPQIHKPTAMDCTLRIVSANNSGYKRLGEQVARGGRLKPVAGGKIAGIKGDYVAISLK